MWYNVVIIIEMSDTYAHNHEEGIKGAEATVIAIYMARKGFSKSISVTGSQKITIRLILP